MLPRGLILLASIWLVASWVLAIGLRAPVEASSASYTPGVRLMLISVAIGMVIGWPLLRLSQSAAPYPIRQTLLDLIVLLALVQVVIWPLRLVTPWTPLRTAALDATLTAWVILVGALVAAAAGSDRPGPRIVAMLGCVGMGLAGPALALLCLAFPATQSLVPRLVGLGPFLEIHAMSTAGGAPPSWQQWIWIGLVALAAVAAWTGLGLLAAPGRDGTGGPGTST